jgi:hypothetical protein
MDWDSFNDLYGTIFSSTDWLDLTGLPYNLHVYHKGDELVGGMVDFKQLNVPLTPYHGIIVKDSAYEYVVSKGFAVQKNLKLVNHHSITDIRPLLWQGYKPVVKYTYLVQAVWIENCDKDTRYAINHCTLKTTTGTIDEFDKLYSRTFENKGLDRPVPTEFLHKLNDIFKPDIYTNGSSMAVIIKDKRMAYYILGASEHNGTSLKLLWDAFQNYEIVDMCGANDEKVALYKRGFGGSLTPCLGVC